ncbi:MAG: MerR family transcriptional regulator [Pyrinomonadaceae bacterium]|nr:MerR family transcriptional regulator [Pyrinomonadaceae bacterium]
MLTTSVLARKADVPVFTVRHYTRIGLLTPKRHSRNGYKIYKESDVSMLKFVSNAKILGFNLKEIAHILDMAKFGETPCPTVREIVVKRINENRVKIENLKRLQRKLEAANSKWATMKDAVPTGSSVFELIDEFDDSSGVTTIC